MDPNASQLIAISNISGSYGKLIGWTLKEGRDFSPQLATDSSGFILNEAAVKLMGLKNPVGSNISFQDKPYHVIGVIHDMIIESPYQAVGPYIYAMAGNYSAFVSIKLDPAMGIQTALAKIGAIYTQYNPSRPFTYQFTDLEYAKKFAEEIRVGKLAAFFKSSVIGPVHRNAFPKVGSGQIS
jgi:putative ABC transport system permease protein